MRKQKGQIVHKSQRHPNKDKENRQRKPKKGKIFFNQTIYKTKNYAYEKPFKQM